MVSHNNRSNAGPVDIRSSIYIVNVPADVSDTVETLFGMVDKLSSKSGC